ncbi:platelet-derived growth factor receptor beta-like isoform X3 [Betta splendens]|uniref:receptor protein-tyrosine kinase n=1 Tax=Betta splendens TaxID=158456 RepID=A0A9W2Y8P5_BETSP|nr:platelet-derived growth factor receptor beta-like isoform X3 [Betta splendens]
MTRHHRSTSRGFTGYLLGSITMMAFIKSNTGSRNLLHFLLGVFLVFHNEAICLELLPSASKLCSGWSQVTWQLPQETAIEGVLVETQGSESSLHLFNATWRSSGRYTCEEASSYQSRQIDVFIPGQGPGEWFVPMGPGVVMKEAEEGTIPCVVSDPQLNVSLYERAGRTEVLQTSYEPGRGFTGHLNDTSYVCLATREDEKRESQVFYVFSIIVPKKMEVDLTVSGSVLKRGEVLTVNCTVKETELVFFDWNFPRQEVIEPLTDFLPNRICSFVNISMATMSDSGVYLCEVKEMTTGQTVSKNTTVTVLDRGYVYLRPSGQTSVSTLLHLMVEFSVEIDAYPAPTVLWTKDNQTVPTEKSFVTTTQLKGSRYLNTLTLVRVQLDQRGSYKVTVTNEDDIMMLIFNLEIKVPPIITALSEVGSTAVLCVSEGAPPPSVTWYTCHISHRCSNTTVGWRSLSAVSEGVFLQENITEIEDRGVTQVCSLLSLQALRSLSAVRCEAQNTAGQRARDVRLLSTSLLSQVAVFVAVLLLVVFAVIFLILLILLWRKKPQYEVRWKVIESVSADGQQYTYLDPKHLPYNPCWEIPRDNIVLGPVLGAGEFGRVVEATVSDLTHSHSTIKVAVKMVKWSSGAGQALMSELKVLIHLGPHLNIVNLLGACTRGGPVYLITEFCHHGNLVNYLQRNKHTFLPNSTHAQSNSDGGYMDMNKEKSLQYVAMHQLNHAKIESAVYEASCISPDQQKTSSPLFNDSSQLSLNDLLSFSYQISQAMDFLKWMAPESIFQNIYSCQSDVWSYGVLLWEIFSLGTTPYPDLPITQEFYSALKREHRMTRPEHAPLTVYEMMTCCWEQQPQARPLFSSLLVSFGKLLTDECKQHLQHLTNTFLRGDPAVVRSRLSSCRAAEDHEDQTGSPTSQVSVNLFEVGPVKAGPSHSTYTIPITDITVEPSSGTVLDADSPHLSDSPSHSTCQDMTSLENKEDAEESPASSCSCEYEEGSCL